MAQFLLSRLLQSIVVLFAILTVTFFLARFAPGSPFSEEKKVPAHILKKTEELYGYDKPLIVQYFKRLGSFARFDLGESFGNKGYKVVEVIKQALPVSLAVGAGGLVFALLFGIPIGVLSAARRNTATDYSLMSIAMVGICLPTFVIGPMLAIIVGIKLNWLPAVNWWNPSTDWILPAMTLGIFYGAYIARLTRAGMLEILGQDYIRTARAKGLSELRILLIHGLKGGLVPVVSYLGPAVAGLIGGSIVMERIFQLPGLGQQIINAASNRDYPLIDGTVLTFGILIVTMNFISDVLLAILNPRQRTQSNAAA
jgi:oligopeptide transport system permease protein